MTYRIVVATDFSEPSAYALRFALTILARIPGSELHLAHVVVDTAMTQDMGRDDRALEDAHERLRTAVAATRTVATADGERIERDVVYHVRLAKNAARAIEQVALDVSADLVVVGMQHRTGLERLVLGSVAEDLLRNGRVALLVARPSTFDGMERTATIDPPKPGVKLDGDRYDMVVSSERIVWNGRPSHIAGLL